MPAPGAGELIGRTVRVSLSASEVVILDGRREVPATRPIRRSAPSLTLDHDLEVLAVMPGARLAVLSRARPRRRRRG